MRGIASLALVLLLLTGCAGKGPVPAADAGGESKGVYRARVHTELAAQYFARRQYSIAVEELREALASDPGYAPAYNVLGLLHGALGEDQVAESHYRHALALAPGYSEAHNNFGYFLCLRGRHDEAIGHFEQAWQNPLYAAPEKALANAAYCSLRRGRTDDGERYAQRALMRVATQPVALMTLAEIQLARGNLAAARAYLRQLASHGSVDAAALWLGVRVERKLGNRTAEADYAAQLRRRFPESDEAGWLRDGQYDSWGASRE